MDSFDQQVRISLQLENLASSSFAWLGNHLRRSSSCKLVQVQLGIRSSANIQLDIVFLFVNNRWKFSKLMIIVSSIPIGKKASLVV